MTQNNNGLIARLSMLGLAPFFSLGIVSSAAGAADAPALRAEATVKGSTADVWRAWTTTEGAQTFFAPKMNIDPVVGGAYEVFFNPADERMSTKGMKVLSIEPEKKISFQWRAPADMANMPGNGTWVVVELRPEGPSATHVKLSQMGWKTSADFDFAVAHFTRGWTEALERLERRFATGPIDWQAEAMMWQEREKAQSKGQ